MFRLPDRHRAFIQLFRPQTLLAPFIGEVFLLIMVAVHVYGNGAWGMLWNDWFPLMNILGTLIIINVASNIINQIYDLDTDKINKPDRPIANGSITVFEAKTVAFVLYAFAMGRTWTYAMYEQNLWFGVFVSLIALVTWAYSCEPMRLKARLWWSAFAQAVARGVLAVVSIWVVYGSITDTEPWAIGLIITVGLCGLANVKDYSDAKGDAATGIRTLPVVYGINFSSAIIIFFVWLSLFVQIFFSMTILPSETIFVAFAVAPIDALLTFSLMSKRFVKLGGIENDITWVLMYAWLAVLFVGFSVATIFMGV